MTNFGKNPAQTFVRIFRPWEIGNYVLTEQEPKPPEQETESNDNMPANSSSSFSGTDSELECASSSSSSSKSSSYEERCNNSSQSTPNSANSPANDRSTATQVPYTNSYLYGSLECAAPPPPPPPPRPPYFTAHFPHAVNSSTQPYMLPSLPAASNSFYYAAAAAAAAVNPDLPSTSAAAYTLNPYAFNFMDREYARVIVEDAQLKAANARKQRPKKFKCNHCDVAFSNNGQLKGHIRIHTGERPFKCDFETCDKTFTRNEELTRHKRIHTGLKPYPCPVCGKCFGRRDHLSKHLKTHLPKATMYLSMYPDFFGI